MVPTKAAISPFLGEYVWAGQGPSTCQMLTCRRCTLSFHDVRLTASESERLYSGYRSDAYVRTRTRLEPEYRDLHLRIGTPGEVDARNANLGRLLESGGIPPSPAKLLDYGGDAGQFIPKFFDASRKFVYDISGASPREDVEAVDDPRSEAPYDFVMCCHVLEHVAEPLPLVEEVRRLLTAGGIAYFEVPWEPLFLERLATILKRRTWNPPPLHEHATFFTSTALRHLVRRAGLSEVLCRVRRLRFGGTDHHVISLLAQRRGEGASPSAPPTRVVLTEMLFWATTRVRARLSGSEVS
ncbi:MAG: class I SAM-dependent methyltransferase [Thermoanaerobaculia bacterium]